jgi:hypothetical protein
MGWLKSLIIEKVIGKYLGKVDGLWFKRLAKVMIYAALLAGISYAGLNGYISPSDIKNAIESVLPEPTATAIP